MTKMQISNTNVQNGLGDYNLRAKYSQLCEASDPDQYLMNTMQNRPTTIKKDKTDYIGNDFYHFGYDENSNGKYNP